MATTLTFLGAAGTVTGSKYLLTIEGRRILVDCGQFQGEKVLRQRNWAPFPVPPDTIDQVLLTHAHLDHCGYLPALVKAGFSGPIWCTGHTAQLAAIVLRDAGHLQERDAAEAAEGGWSKHRPPLPLYDGADVERTLPLLTAVDWDRDLDLGGGVSARFTRAGHILGAASICVTTPQGSVLFSGDLGRHDHPVLRPRDTPPGADYVVIESTYGDREHPEPRELPHEPLADVIRRSIGRGGSVLIPAFAVDRTEVVLKVLGEMMRHERIPRVPVYVNSPMATAALDVYRSAPEELRVDVDPRTAFDVGELHEVRTADESRELTRGGHRPSIIISSSGMATGGRVLHHLERMLPDSRNAVVLTGYQAVGTRGRALEDGVTRLKMHGRYVGVRAEIVKDEEFSVHGDASDIVDWVREVHPAPVMVFCTHGEPPAAQALAARLEAELGLEAVAATQGEVVTIDAARDRRHAPATPPGRVASPPPVAAPAVAAAPAAAHLVLTPSGGVALGVRVDGRELAGREVTGAHVSSDLVPRPGPTPGEIVFEGTITITVSTR